MSAITVTGGSSPINTGDLSSYTVTLPAPTDGVGVIAIATTLGTIPLSDQIGGMLIGSNTGLVMLVLSADTTTFNFPLISANAGRAVITIANTFGWDDPAAIAVVVTLPDSPPTATGNLIVLDTNQQPVANALVTFRMIAGPGTAGYSFDSDSFTVTGDGDGNVTFDNFVQGAKYGVKRGYGNEQTFTVPSADSFDIAQSLGD